LKPEDHRWENKEMSNLPDNLKYTKTHEWVQENTDGTLTVGITDHAQGLLGDLVFVELPETGVIVGAGDECAVLESVKAASDLYSPVSGEIIEVNELLADNPDAINKDAYGDGWIFKLQPTDDSELDDLLDATSYLEVASAEDH